MTKQVGKVKNRSAILACACVNTFCFGGLYAWSAFSGELANFNGWDYGKVSFAYSLQLIVLVVMGIVGGGLLQKLGPRKLITLSGIMWGMGWLLTGFSTSIPMLYLVFGVLIGFGTGAMAFGLVMSAVTPMLGEKRAAAFSGIINGAGGIGGSLLAPFAQFLLDKGGLRLLMTGLSVLSALIAAACVWLHFQEKKTFSGAK